jgi:ADP-heptose:LPS heptosyltransferase
MSLPQDLESMHPQKIVVIRRNGLGDLLMSVPMMYRLRQFCPNASIHLLLGSRNVGLVPFFQNPPWDSESELLGKNKYLSIVREGIQWRYRGLDLIISAKPTPMKLINIFMGISGAKWKRAVVDGAWHSRFVNWPMNEKDLPDGQHQAFSLIRLVDAKAVEFNVSEYPVLFAPPTEFTAQCSHAFLKAKFLKGDAINVYLSISNNRETSQPSNQQMIKMLKSCHNVRLNVIIVAMKADMECAKKLYHSLSRECPDLPVLYLCTKNIHECLELISLCDLIFTGDGGTMHLAAALNKYQLVLFGQTSVKQWHPLSSRAVCLPDCLDVKNLDDDLIHLSFDQQVERALKAKRS